MAKIAVCHPATHQRHLLDAGRRQSRRARRRTLLLDWPVPMVVELDFGLAMVSSGLSCGVSSLTVMDGALECEVIGMWATVAWAWEQVG